LGIFGNRDRVQAAFPLRMERVGHKSLDISAREIVTDRRKAGFLFEEIYLWHDAAMEGFPVEPGHHFENPDTKRRLRNLLAVSGLLDELHPIKATPATEDDVARFHTREYIAQIKRMSAERGGEAGEFTPFGAGSFEIALLAAGGVMRAVEAVVTGAVENAYALVRPPGHHAEANRGRGYCIFGNIAVAIMYARAKLGVARVAVVDWDVHHGNGTQAAFYEDPNILTISIHQDNLYPANSGGIDENGAGRGAGYNLNLPMPPGCGGGAYVAAFERVIVPALRKFKAELIVVASGLDAGALDPLGRMMLHSDHYRHLTRMLLEVASAVSAGRIVLAHEGGYSAIYVPFCGLAIMEELSGIRSKIVDPYIELAESWGYQELQPHQAAAIERAAPLLARIK
jgi:acetoin utilization deacetylase AcuC-like enzyme